MKAAGALDPQGLGQGLRRCFPVPQDAAFDSLLERLAHSGTGASTQAVRPCEQSRPERKPILGGGRLLRYLRK